MSVKHFEPERKFGTSQEGYSYQGYFQDVLLHFLSSIAIQVALAVYIGRKSTAN